MHISYVNMDNCQIPFLEKTPPLLPISQKGIHHYLSVVWSLNSL